MKRIRSTSRSKPLRTIREDETKQRREKKKSWRQIAQYFTQTRDALQDASREEEKDSEQLRLLLNGFCTEVLRMAKEEAEVLERRSATATLEVAISLGSLQHLILLLYSFLGRLSVSEEIEGKRTVFNAPLASFTLQKLFERLPVILNEVLIKKMSQPSSRVTMEALTELLQTSVASGVPTVEALMEAVVNELLFSQHFETFLENPSGSRVLASLIQLCFWSFETPEEETSSEKGNCLKPFDVFGRKLVRHVTRIVLGDQNHQVQPSCSIRLLTHPSYCFALKEVIDVTLQEKTDDEWIQMAQQWRSLLLSHHVALNPVGSKLIRDLVQIDTSLWRSIFTDVLIPFPFDQKTEESNECLTSVLALVQGIIHGMQNIEAATDVWSKVFEPNLLSFWFATTDADPSIPTDFLKTVATRFLKDRNNSQNTLCLNLYRSLARVCSTRGQGMVDALLISRCFGSHESLQLCAALFQLGPPVDTRLASAMVKHLRCETLQSLANDSSLGSRICQQCLTALIRDATEEDVLPFRGKPFRVRRLATFVRRFQSLFPVLASNPFGSFLVEAICLRSFPLELREESMNKLLKHSSEIRQSVFGRKTLSKCKSEQFQRQRIKWMEEAEREIKRQRWILTLHKTTQTFEESN